ncbi:MAG: acyl-CoA dehydrogenase, partial [Actinocrinis sp.]
VRSLTERAVGHLSGRVVGGEPTIRKQLVLGTVADLVTETEAIRRLLMVAGTVSAAVADAHERLTVLGWEAAKLFGASGYLVDGPTRGVYVSRLVANCWVVTEAGV